MKSFLMTCCLSLFSILGWTQISPYYNWGNLDSPVRLDSLQTALKNTMNDTLRMVLFRDLGLFYVESKVDSSLYYIDQQMTIAKNLHLKFWEAAAYDDSGYALKKSGNYTLSLQNFLEGIKIVEDSETEKSIWYASYFTKKKTARIARLILLGNLLNDLAGLYWLRDDFEKAMSNQWKARGIAESIDDQVLLSIANMNLGSYNFELNLIDSALLYYKNSQLNMDKSGFRMYKGFILRNIGRIYASMGDKQLARKYFTNSIYSNLNSSNQSNLADSYISMASVLKDSEEMDSSLYYATKGLAIYRNNGELLGTFQAYTTLTSIYKQLHLTDSAFIYQELAMALKDSLSNVDKVKQFENIGFEEQLKIQQLQEENDRYESKVRLYASLSGLTIVLLIALLLHRNNRQKQKANMKLEAIVANLKSTQSQLIQSEKMASLGELTAGIAHEIQNPLNFVNNFSEVSNELIKEIQDIRRKTQDVGIKSEEDELLKDIEQNLEKINHHGKRAADIVKGMLQHSRSSSGVKEPTDINALADEYLRLAYHGLRAKDKSFNAKFETDFDSSLPKINVVPQDIGRVVLNLINNAFYAVNDQRSTNNEQRDALVIVSTKNLGTKIEISVKDNGSGIPQKILDKIFQPFFTTKPTGQGTGLGLSLSYDIVKAHGGELKVETKVGEGSTFAIRIPA